MSHHSLVEKESIFGKPMFALDARQIIGDVSTYLNNFPATSRETLVHV
jgi:hypothetical protein